MAGDLDEVPHLGHTVRVALSRDGAFLGLPGAGHTTSARTGASGPHLDRDEIPPRLSVRTGDTTDRGGRWTTDRKTAAAYQRDVRRKEAAPIRAL